jgi:hypothetical protein
MLVSLFEMPMPSSKFGPWLGWSLACVFFGTTAFLAWQQLQPGPGVQSENLGRIKEGMPLEQVERILGPLHSSLLAQAPKSAVWKHWTRLKTDQEGWEDVFSLAFVDGRLARTWTTSKPTNPEPDRFVKEVFSLDKLLRPTMGGGDFILAYEYRGGFVDCWLEASWGERKEAFGQIFGMEFRKKVRKWTAEMENNVHGNIYWDPFSSGSDDINLLVTATADEAQGLLTNFKVQRGVNHGLMEKWTSFGKGEPLTSVHGPEPNYLLVPNEERILYTYKYQDGEIRLMCKLAAAGP